MKYMNNNNIQYIINPINTNNNLLNIVFCTELRKSLIVSSDIKIVLLNVSSNSFIRKQLTFNNISYIEINNVVELSKLNLDCKYILLLANSDFIIVNNLDSNFLSTFCNRVAVEDLKILFAGQSINIPSIDIEDSDILLARGFNKFLNGNILLGDVSDIKKYAEVINILNQHNINFLNEVSPKFKLQLQDRFIIKYNLTDIYYGKGIKFNNIDSDNKLFTTLIDSEQELRELDNVRFIYNQYTSNDRLF